MLEFPTNCKECGGLVLVPENEVAKCPVCGNGVEHTSVMG